MDIRKFIRSTVRSLLSEGHEHTSITKDNLNDLYQKLVPVLHDDQNLRKGLEFAHTNMGDYGSDEFATGVIDSFLRDVNVYIVKHRPNFYDQFDTGYTGYKWTGAAYDRAKNMPLKEIAMLIRQELQIRMEGWRFSVKTDYFSGGKSLDVKILDLPYNPFTPEYNEALANDQDFQEDRGPYGKKMFTEQYDKDKQKVKTIVEQYRMDDSDGMIDYSHTNFYCSVDLDTDAIIGKYHPNNKQYLRTMQFRADWDAAAKKRSEAAKARKGKYKKGMEVIYTYDYESRSIPKGEYRGVILKSPNGRALFSNYEIRFIVDKKFDAQRNVIPAERPMTYTASVSESDIRPIDQ